MLPRPWLGGTEMYAAATVVFPTPHDSLPRRTTLQVRYGPDVVTLAGGGGVTTPIRAVFTFLLAAADRPRPRQEGIRAAPTPPARHSFRTDVRPPR